MRRLFAIVALATAAACGDSPGKTWLVDRPRVLGARLEADTVTWLVVAPGAPRRFGWSFATCAAPLGNFAPPRCDGPIVTAGSGASDGEAIRMTVGVLPEASLVVAAFCEGDPPASFDARSFEARCASGAEPLLASVKSSAPGNRNPDVAEAAIATPSACVPPDASEQSLVFRFDDTQREPGETLLLGAFVTAGELDRTYATLEANEPAPKDVRFAWKPPPDEGDVRMFFVLRDGRGGTTFVVRNACVRR